MISMERPGDERQRTAGFLGLDIRAEDWFQKQPASTQHMNCPEGLGVRGVSKGSRGSRPPPAATMQHGDVKLRGKR